MTRSQAESVVSYLNAIYTGPVDGVFRGCAAFASKRTCSTDSSGFWEYYITSPFGVFLNGSRLSDREESLAVSEAEEIVLCFGSSRK